MTKPHRRIRAAGTLGAVSVLTLLAGLPGSALASSDSGPTEEQLGGSIDYAIRNIPDCIDPHQNPSLEVEMISRNALESLVEQTPDGFVPWLADSWEVSDDQTEFTFVLREGVTFHDGTALTADVVKANFDHIVDPETKSQAAIVLFGTSYEGTEVVDEQTVKVTFAEPFSSFLYSVSTVFLGIESGESLAERSNEDLCAGVVGTGPFVVDSVIPTQSVSFSRNADYATPAQTASNQGPAYLESLTITGYPEDSTRVGTLQNGESDVISDLPAVNALDIESNDDFAIHRVPFPGAGYNAYLNNTRPPFDDQRVRRAFQIGFDLDAAVETIHFGYFDRPWSPIGPATAGYDEQTEGSWAFDAELAGSLLDEAGYSEFNDDGIRVNADGEPLHVVWLQVMPGEQNPALAQVVQSELRKIGFDVELKPGIGTPGEPRNSWNSGDYDISDFSFVENDASVLGRLFHSTAIPTPDRAGWNLARLAEPQVDEWLAAAQAADDPAERDEYAANIQEFVLDEAHVVPLTARYYLGAASSDVQGVEFDAQGIPVFRSVWVE